MRTAAARRHAAGGRHGITPGSDQPGHTLHLPGAALDTITAKPFRRRSP